MNDRPIFYPWAGHPRVFRAVAMPNGDARFGVSGQLVMLCEQRGKCQDRPRILSRAEAEQLRDEIGAALRAFDLAKDFARGVATEVGARAATAPFPFHDHRTLAEAGFADTPEAA